MKKILIIGHVWPEPFTTAAGHRMVQLIEAFISFHWKVTFVSTSTKTRYSADLKSLGVDTEFIQLNHSSFDEFVKDLNPNYVIFDRFMAEEQFGWRVAEQAPNAVRILNTEDLHSLRKTREECHKKGEEFSVTRWKQFDTSKREIASIYRSDLSLMVSKFEMNLLMTELKIPESMVWHLPFMLDEITSQEQQRWPTFEERSDFITYGNGKHAPNVDAIKYLKEEIWPRIRKVLPKAHLKIFGAYLPQHIEQMHNPKEGFHIMGWVENLDVKIQKARLVLAPLRFGAGIKGKITDALKNGTPVITTNIGEEGMSLDLSAKQIVNDGSPDTFAKAAVELYTNTENWEVAQKKGIESINTQYSKEIYQKQLVLQLEALSRDIAKHREENFIGSLLQHQTMAATKFMGKWIEAKNTKQ